MKEHTFTLTETALHSLISIYVDHKLAKSVYEESEEYPETSGDYLFHCACCETAENWMRAIGIHPDSNYVGYIIDKESKRI